MDFATRIYNRLAGLRNDNSARLACCDIAREADAEIERLTKALTVANSQAERFERGWYLRGDALEKLQQWAKAYPLTVFPPPDLKRAHEVLTAAGMTLDAISADAMRHVITQTVEIVDAGLRA